MVFVSCLLMICHAAHHAGSRFVAKSSFRFPLRDVEPIAEIRGPVSPLRPRPSGYCRCIGRSCCAGSRLCMVILPIIDCAFKLTILRRHSLRGFLIDH